MFVLVAKMFDKNKFGDKCYRNASVIELIHTATLVHDDVVDEKIILEEDFFQSILFGKIKSLFL